MKKQKKPYLKLFAAACIFLLSIFIYDHADSAGGMDCWICVGDGAGYFCQMNPTGHGGCSIWDAGGIWSCAGTGSFCGCPDPTVPCEA